ncbi:ATP-grasp domain-containing protein [Stygiobacter electus]|uniref:ATP-grasp domain-containing protein n=1 Tax=Stygiobacter electus TaxID=3032292 RepID=A0AAE3P2S6_9BACT|nr:hypothetical protein [Stygiobacter electus]MDF1611830.1 hypothetical protein [Stygiobacter electus]
MEQFDLAISFTWEYDYDFIELIEDYFQYYGLKTYLIKPDNVHDVINLLQNKKLQFTALLDRASDEDVSFIPIAQILKRRKCYIINPYQKVIKTIDKAIMHNKLLENKFKLPKTYILSSFKEDYRLLLTEKDLDHIGKPFIIKPSLYSGGGEGVIKNATTLEEIQQSRMKSPDEKFLIQEKIYPRTISGKRAWFRLIWAFDTVIPTFWDDQLHIYNILTAKEIKQKHLQQLMKITKRLAQITKLDYFSTEIALTKDHKFYLIDYINDQIDMRLKSKHIDGVPDKVVNKFIERMYYKILSL